MMEEEWLACGDSERMLRFLSTRAGDRKSRLFGCACCRAEWTLLVDERSRKAVEVAEEAADGLSSAENQERAFEAACQASDELDELCVAGLDEVESAEREARWSAAQMADRLLVDPLWANLYEIAYGASQVGNVPALLRDIFGNPFRSVAFAMEWRTSTAVALAQQMYESRDFGALPILADALQDAGCDSEEVLGHCRDAHATHVRGCWVVDLVLGK